jgi:biopolymer transport protein ExbD
MSKFLKSAPREVPALNTASLPDLVFTILFFFMIVTHMRTVPVMTQLEVPTAAELEMLNEKSLIVYIMAGKGVLDKKQGTISNSNETIIQLNSDFVSLSEMPAHLCALKKRVSLENQNKMIAVLKIDKNTSMETVNDIKQALREAGILKLHYSAAKIPLSQSVETNSIPEK